MKKTKYYLITMLSVLFFHTALAQDAELLRDSIHYKGDENVDLLILTRDYHKLQQNETLNKVLDAFQADLQEIQVDLPAGKPFVIDYWHREKIEIQENTRIKSYQISREQGLEEKFLNQVNIHDADSGTEVIISFNDIKELLKADLSFIGESISKELPVKHRFLRSLEYQQDTSSRGLKLTQDRFTGYMDMLSLKAGVGANVFQNRLLTDISGEIGLHLNQKGILKDQFYISNNLLFSFDVDRSLVTNNFTNIGYRRNFSNQRDKPNWLGVEFGMLTKRSGDIFKPNTLRLGVNWEIGKNISVSPQLYFNGFFKQVSPGFRVGIGF
ncbi:hypothetical protein [Cyclobacterium sp.]|uniref:hypothetical protein n=1 Tax=Cyclobacterium sp. TaxID=1966343 RepID=UPI0019B37CC4|nr:hypothetical protein [Cyclobacterium sp.]MBD3627166.1 hypothetical protein [Cyclobacterium sp.]